MKSVFFFLAFSTLAFGAGKELEGERAAANSACPSPEEARAKMSVPEGYEVRCWAHEPMVVNPVAMTWDARGRLWVVEGYEYPNGSEFKNNAFGGEATDDKYHAVPAVCQAKDNPLNAMRADHPPIPKDRIVILEDTDNDGVADKRTVFLEGLDMGSAILCGDGGVYVGQQPHLLHFRDNDGDDHADEWRVVLTGFGREDTHELLNSFCWGPDGWLYMTHGVFTNSKVRRPGVAEKDGFKFDAGIGRCRPTAQGKDAPWEFEVFADGTSNPWGCDYDERGNFFVSACVIDHFFHMAPGGIYVRQGGAPENPYSYEQLPSIVTHKHFRAAYAGVQIYQGGVYPKDTWGHAFIGNIHDNAIHEEVLTPVGSTFKCEPRRDFLRANNGWFRPVSTRTGPDGNLWVMDWCDKYPCYQNAKANPEGVDREKGRIWRIVSLKGNEGRGGVWSAAASDSATPLSPKRANSQSPTGSTPSTAPAKAVSPPLQGSATALQDASRPTKDMDLSKLDTPALVKLLGDSNNWMRRWARRELIEHPTPQAIQSALALIKDKQGDAKAQSEAGFLISSLSLSVEEFGQAMQALWQSRQPSAHMALARTIANDSGLALLDETNLGREAKQGDFHLSEGSILADLAADPDPGVRPNALSQLRRASGHRLTKDNEEPQIFPRGAGLSPVVGRLDLVEELTKALRANGQSDNSIQFATWMVIEPLISSQPKRYLEFLGKESPSCQPLSHTLTYKSMRRLCDTRDAKNIDLALDFLTKIKSHDVLLAHALDGLEKGQESGIIKPTKEFSPLFAELAKSDNADVRKHAQNLATLWGDAAAIRQITASLLDAKTPEAQRIIAAQTLRKVKCDDVSEALVKLLSAPEGQPSALIIEVIRAAADAGGDAFIAPLVKLATSKDYATQLAAFGALTNRGAWTHALLDAIGAKTITAVGFPASVRRQLATSKDKAIRDHAFKVLGAWKDSSDDVKALIAAKKQACLEGEPDLAAGKLLFTTTCAVCHTFFGGGQKVGPELIGSGRSNLDAILANVIDPNQIIGNGYENIIINTKDNRTLMGRITEDTPSHVKLLAIGGAEQIVPRDQIAKLENTHQSLMPMGFGGLPDDQFRNLIWYVLAPPDEGPLTPAKKKQLSTAVDAAPTAANKPKRPSDRAIDWESISLWNPQWKVSAPDFERTPMKLAEYYGRSNVLLMHPFPDKQTPSSLEQKLTVDATKPHLKFSVASDDRGDWQLRVTVNGEEIKRQDVGHDQPRWKDIALDLANYVGKEITVRLEGHATGWSMEFGYWHSVRWE